MLDLDKAVSNVFGAKDPQRAREQLRAAIKDNQQQIAHDRERATVDRRRNQSEADTRHALAEWLATLDPQLLTYARQPARDSFLRGFSWVRNAVLVKMTETVREQQKARTRAVEVETARQLGPLAESERTIRVQERADAAKEVERLQLLCNAEIKAETARIRAAYALGIAQAKERLASSTVTGDVLAAIVAAKKQLTDEFDGRRQQIDIDTLAALKLIDDVTKATAAHDAAVAKAQVEEDEAAQVRTQKAEQPAQAQIKAQTAAVPAPEPAQ